MNENSERLCYCYLREESSLYLGCWIREANLNTSVISDSIIGPLNLFVLQ
jgi:hypothetical protein